MTAIVRTLLMLLFVASDASPSFAAEKVVRYSGEGLTWKAVFMTGDNSIQAFDNARIEAVRLWRNAGLKPQHIRQLSMRTQYQKGRVKAASAKNLEKALLSLKVKKGDACIVWLSSHGQLEGFYMVEQEFLSPAELDGILDRTCGDNPTVLMVSACHSGVFLELEADHRVILTASHQEKKSFGCGVKDVLTFWDGCILKYYRWSKTFEGLSYRSNICIQNREAQEDVVSSEPQAVFGKNVRYLMIPRPGLP